MCIRDSNLSFVLFGRAAFLLLYSLCRLESVHDGGLLTGFGGFDLCGLVLLRTVVEDVYKRQKST